MYFSGIKAVDDLSFDIKKKILGLIGPNGARTRCSNCVTQFRHKPMAGSIFYRNRFGNVSSRTTRRPRSSSWGSRAPSGPGLVYWMSILDNLLVGARFLSRTLADRFLHSGRLKREETCSGSAIQLLDRLGISPTRMSPRPALRHLKKVELALMSEPQLIILDEPAAGLNDAETDDLAEIIRKIRDDFGCTIFLVEHDMNLVMNVCDTVCAISFGKMLAIGTPEEIQDNPLVQEAYLGTE